MVSHANFNKVQETGPFGSDMPGIIHAGDLISGLNYNNTGVYKLGGEPPIIGLASLDNRNLFGIGPCRGHCGNWGNIADSKLVDLDEDFVSRQGVGAFGECM